ncbi:hypothetical protein EMN47_12040 [Prolixibacteraceae bacterium JC049]|nr:hypothetical protein [Prolixibacteraceae bacterium JC049]
MKKLKFEYQITVIYLLIGGLWIVFSDEALNLIINDQLLLTKYQTYKGWFYVFVTATLFFMFLKKHLNRIRNTEHQLAQHKKNLEAIVLKKTEALEQTNSKLQKSIDELNTKNEIIYSKNTKLHQALTELKETEAQLIQSEKMASLGILTAGVAHEINNPLNFIMGAHIGLSNYFEDHGSNAPEETDVFLESIKIGIDRTTDIVDSLNSFSRSNTKLDETCNIHSIIDNCLVILNNRMKHKIQIEKKYYNEELTCLGNVGKMHQAVINILYNSIQAIPDKGKISISTSIEKDNVIIEIKDNGIGIASEHLNKITDPFFTTKPPGEGTGLGLSITYSIIKELNGSIQFYSEVNKGTNVVIELPRTEMDKESIVRELELSEY